MKKDFQLRLRQALGEDIGSGDITTDATIPKATTLQGDFVAKGTGIIAGLEVTREIFVLQNPDIVFKKCIEDGSTVTKGTIIATVHGPGRDILSAERTALNFLQRMSGIATQTRAFVDTVKGTKAVILDTRKTAPGLRFFDKWAVRLGGGQNHRFGLFDMAIIKDNHIAASGGISKSFQEVRAHTNKAIEIEVTTLEELNEAVSLKPERIMLDNMDATQMRECVRIVGGKIPLEASGNVTIGNVRKIAQTGVDYISVGSLTHSVKALNISLEIA